MVPLFCPVTLLVLCSGFQAAALKMLISLQGEMKELKKMVAFNTSMLQIREREITDDNDVTLAGGPQLPMSSSDHMEAMETALDDVEYRKRLVRKLVNECFTSDECHQTSFDVIILYMCEYFFPSIFLGYDSVMKFFS